MTKKQFLFLYLVIKPYLPKKIAGFILIIFSTILSLLTPYVIMQIIDISIFNKDLYSLRNNMIIFLLIMISTIIISVLIKIIFLTILENLFFDLRQLLLEKTLKKPLLFFYSRPPGEIITIFLKEITIITDYVTNTLVQIITNISLILFSFYIMFTLNHFIATFTLIVIILVYFLLKHHNPKIKERNIDIMKTDASVTNTLQEILSNLYIIKIFYSYSFCNNMFSDIQKKLIKLRFKLYNLEIKINLLLSFLYMLPSILLLTYGSYLVIKGDMSIGNLIALNLYINKVFEPVRTISGLNITTQKFLAAFYRFYSLIETNDIDNNKKFANITKIKQGISLANINYTYKPDNNYLLSNINANFELGDKILIKGANGTGKTTLINLICGIINVDSGIIKYDDIDIKHISLNNLTNLLGVIPQDNYLFNGTVRENICLGRKYNENTIYKLVDQIGFNNLFTKDINLNTIILPKGTNLSGGQKKQISILRGLIHEPQIIILDEPSTFIDEETKKHFFKYLSMCTNNKIIILISHEELPYLNYNKVILLENILEGAPDVLSKLSSLSRQRFSVY